MGEGKSVSSNRVAQGMSYTLGQVTCSEVLDQHIIGAYTAAFSVLVFGYSLVVYVLYCFSFLDIVLFSFLNEYLGLLSWVLLLFREGTLSWASSAGERI